MRYTAHLGSMQPRDWTLLVVSKAETCLQPVQLQKALFLLGENLTKPDLNSPGFYNFRAYDYGPFSAEVYQDAETLEQEGMMAIARPPVTRFKVYSATDAGRARAETLMPTLTPTSQTYLGKVVTFVTALSFDELVSAIYTAYPKMRANSVFKDQP